MEKQKILKREGYISWDEYFMAVALLSAQRSKDPNTQVGACIVSPDKKNFGVGYNGLPIGCSDDEFPWGRDGGFIETKYAYVCHAELNAILNSIHRGLAGCILYVALFPCNECAKTIIQSGINEIVYLSDKYAATESTIAAKKMFDTVGIKYRELDVANKHIDIDFTPL